MSKRVGVILSGCGFKDGAEIHESVLTLLALDRAGAEVVCMAPNVEQSVVVDHLSGERTHERRNVLVESARIARGKILDLAQVQIDELDALILPGGYGAATNLSNFAELGPEAEVHPEVERLLRAARQAKKPIGAICIAPGVVARVLGHEHVKLTVGDDPGTAQAIRGTGAVHVDAGVEEVVVDVEHKIVSTPAYMLGPSIRHVAVGIERCVQEVLRLA